MVGLNITFIAHLAFKGENTLAATLLPFLPLQVVFFDSLQEIFTTPGGTHMLNTYVDTLGHNAVSKREGEK